MRRLAPMADVLDSNRDGSRSKLRMGGFSKSSWILGRALQVIPFKHRGRSFSWHISPAARCGACFNTPFLLAWPGVKTEEIGACADKGSILASSCGRFPKDIATHSAIQTLYFQFPGAALKRHDYDVEIAGNTPGAHLIDGYIEVSGIRFPTKQHVSFARQPDGSFNTEPLVVSIDLSNIRLS